MEKLTFSVPKLRAAPASFMFYTGLSVESFDDILYLVGGAASTLTYSGAELLVLIFQRSTPGIDHSALMLYF